MTGSIWQAFIQDGEGNVLDSASIEVRESVSNNLASIFSDINLMNAKANPFLSDSEGYAFFYSASNRYTITVTKDALTTIFANVQLGNSREYDVGSSSGQIPAVDNLDDVAFSGDYADLSNTPTLGTLAAQNEGTGNGDFRDNLANDGRYLQILNNLSDLESAATARNNLGVAIAAQLDQDDVDWVNDGQISLIFNPDESVEISLPDNLASALKIYEDVNDILVVDTLDGNEKITINYSVTLSTQLTSTVTTGTAPLVVASTTKVSNLNSDLLDDADWSAPNAIGSVTPNSGAFTTLSASGQITSTVSTGTAPLVVASTTAVANLNASFLTGNTWAIPGTIGSSTPNTGAFTTLTASLPDDASKPFRIFQGANDYIYVNTTNGAELIEASVLGEGFRIDKVGDMYCFGASVAHGFTGITSASNAGAFRKSSSTGGLTFSGFRATNALNFLGYRTTPNTDSGTGGSGCVLFFAAKSDGGTGATTVGDSEVMYSFHNNETTNPKLWINGNGTIGTLGNAKIGGYLTLGGATASVAGTIALLQASGDAFTSRMTGVAHGMTTLALTDQFVTLDPINDATGGVRITGYSADTRGNSVIGYVATESTAELTSSDACVEIQGAKKSGTTVTALGSTGNIAMVRNFGSAVVFFKGDGSIVGSGSLRFVSGTINTKIEIEASTAGSGAPNVLTSSETMKLLTNEGATAETYNTLPTAVAGLVFEFVCQDVDGIRITASAGDTIRIDGSVSAAAGFVRSSTIGSTLRLVAINATEWIAMAAVGTWLIDA